MTSADAAALRIQGCEFRSHSKHRLSLSSTTRQSRRKQPAFSRARFLRASSGAEGPWLALHE